MSNSPYVAYAQRAADIHRDSVTRHFQAMLEKGLLGEDPSEKLLQAAVFEMGCLYLYLLDHELRRGRKEDVFLNEVWGWIGTGLLEMFPSVTADQEAILILGWRLGRYEDVTASIEADDTYGSLYASVKLDDYFFCLAEQFLRCLNADASVQNETGIFWGVVSPETIIDDPNSEPQLLRALSILKEMLFEYALPLNQVARLWSNDTAFYEKSLEELDDLTELGVYEAGLTLKQRKDNRLALYSQLRWTQMYSDSTQFLLGPFSDDPATDDAENEWGIETDENGYPYLQVLPAPEESPESIGLRRLLLLAHDLGTGITTRDMRHEKDDDIWALPLSLGGVDTLLRYSDNDSPSNYSTIDVSELQPSDISQPDAWNISGSARVSLAKFYLDSEEAIRQELGHYSGGFYGWIGDESGAGTLVLAPANQILVSYASWVLGPNKNVIGEMQPNLARYPLTDTDDENNAVAGRATLDYKKPIPEGLAVVHDEESLFVRAHQIIYGTAGEPYEVITQTEDADAGRPLLDFALPCYDSGRGIALFSKEDTLIWRLAFGDLIGFLCEGTLVGAEAAFGMASEENAGKPVALDPDGPVFRPDRLDLPLATEAGIAWVLRRAGITSPKMGMLYTDTGKPVLLFGPAPTSPDVLHWMNWRTAWYLPVGAPVFLFINHPSLTPFDMQ